MEIGRWKDVGRRNEGGRQSMDTGCTRIESGHGGVAPVAVVSAHWSVVVGQKRLFQVSADSLVKLLRYPYNGINSCEIYITFP